VILRRAKCRRASPVVVVLAVLLVAACKHDIDRKLVTTKNQGTLCLGARVGGDAGATSPADLPAGQPLAITVRSMCLSDACATARSAKCSVKRDGDRVVVTSEMVWKGPDEIGYRCPAECSFLDAHCTTEPLPAGNYKVVLGARTVDVALPSHLDRWCLDAPGFTRYPDPVDASAPSTPHADAGVAAAPAAPGALAAVPAGDAPSAPATGVVPAPPPPGDTVCIAPAIPSKTRALKAGQAIAITILHKNPCLGASCTSAPAKCTAKRKGTHIAVTPQFPSSTTKPTKPCSGDCNALAATCRTDNLPAGSYTIELGTQQKTIQIPSPTAPPCGN
jgi:hypothetical protein